MSRLPCCIPFCRRTFDPLKHPGDTEIISVLWRNRHKKFTASDPTYEALI